MRNESKQEFCSRECRAGAVSFTIHPHEQHRLQARLHSDEGPRKIRGTGISEQKEEQKAIEQCCLAASLSD